jgi:hypothetical protein
MTPTTNQENKMNGSEKQIKWAEDIKEGFLNQAAQIKDEANRNTVIDFLNAVDDAKMFINDRNLLAAFWRANHKGIQSINKNCEAYKFAVRLRESNSTLYAAAKALYADDFKYDIC